MMTEKSNPSARETFGPVVATFRAINLPGALFELRPIATSAPDGMVGILYLRSGRDFRQSGVGCCFKGAWRRTRNGAPLEGNFYWALMVNEKDESPELAGANVDG